MASFYAFYPPKGASGGGGGSGVTSLNEVTGVVDILAGSGISVSTVGQDITISSTGSSGVTAVTASSPVLSSGGTTPNISFHELIPSISQTVYVSLAGNDTTGNGSPTSPYLTIGKAFSVITGSSISNPYVVDVGAGVFTETNLTFPVWTFLKGSGVQGTSIIDTSGTINMASAAFSSGSQRCGMQDLRVRQTNLAVNFFAVGGSGSDQVYLNNLQIDGTLTMNGRGSDDSTVIGCKIFGTVTNNSMQDFFEDCLFDSDVNETDTNGSGSTTYVSSYSGCTFFGNLNITAVGPTSVFSTVTASPVSGTVTVTGSTAQLTADSTTVGHGVTLASGGILINISDTVGVAYTPSTPANWPVQPASAQQALDDLAARSSGFPTVQLFTLNSTNISNGFVTLASTPTSPMSTILLVTTAPNQFYGSDFQIVSGSLLSWNGLGLAGVLSAGDTLTVSYF